jgi:hypothetical protein
VLMMLVLHVRNGITQCGSLLGLVWLAGLENALVLELWGGCHRPARRSKRWGSCVHAW